MLRYFYAIAIIALFSGSSSPVEVPLTEYIPIMMHRDELNRSVGLRETKPLLNTGKMNRFNNILFIVEPYKGIHVFDNTNPSQPLPKSFIRIPGCIDLAIKDGFLYADNAVDLVTLDISNLGDIKLVDRQENVFPESLPPDQREMPIVYEKSHRPEGLIIVEWKRP